MPRPRPHSAASTATRDRHASSSSADPWAWLTHLAFILLLAVTVARATTLEWTGIRQASSLAETQLPRTPGPTASLALDLLACLPAILILLRRSIDRRTYILRSTWSLLPLALLAAWMLASRFWAADRFAATVLALNFVSAVAMLWAAIQLVRSWQRLRLVAATLFGLLLIYGAWCFFYHWIDLPDMQRAWAQNKAQLLQQQGLQPGSFGAIQLEKNLTNGATLGFSASPNTYAAATVLLLLVTAGLAIQRWRDRNPEDWGLGFLIIVATITGAAILYYTRSRAAVATLLLGFLLLALLFTRLRSTLAAHPRKAFLATLILIIAGMLAGVLHALHTNGFGTFASSSLTFRWQYWVGSARLIARHPLLGVGWNSFGLNYLQTRLPQASEEVRDPHNFIVRFAVELGLIGAALALAWLARMWWELTRPSLPAETTSPTAKPPHLLRAFTLIGLLAILLNILVNIDFNSDPYYVLLESLKRLLYFGLFLIGGMLAALRSLQSPDPDQRAAPWVLYGTLAALAMFLLHNLIDFSLFETGPMCLFMVLAGSIIGVRLPSVAQRKRHDRLAIASLVAVSTASLATFIFFLIPVSEAEQRANLAAHLFTAGRPNDAATLYKDAYTMVPSNADYAFRSAKSLIAAHMPPAEIRGRFDMAIAANPLAANYYLERATYESSLPSPDRQQILADFQSALRLDPHDVPARFAYADLLTAYNMPVEAREHYTEALADDNALDPANPRRLPPAQRSALEKKLAPSPATTTTPTH